MKTIRAVIVVSLAMVLLSRTMVFAQGGGAAPEGTGAMQFEKGTVELGGFFGTTLPVNWLRQHKDRRITMASLDVGRVMTNQLGPGLLAGQFEFLLEITPLLVLHQPQHVFGLAASPLHMRWNFVQRWAPRPGVTVRPFAEASGGIIFTNQGVPVRAAAFNFIDQAGFGVRIETGPKRAWLAGYRFQHISSAGRVSPNPGTNFNFLYAGVTFGR